ncbi:MAG: HlyD family efflux transporter periplasmic adaptor subunit [Acidobacteriota bacterium]
MPNTFSHSLRHLAGDNLRRSTLGLFFITLFLGVWIAWSLLARVAIYETASSARLEVERAVHLIEAPISGRVIATNLVVGRNVQAGEVLVELDSEAERLQVVEEQDRIKGLSTQVNAIYNEIKAEEETGRKERQAAQVGLDEARSKYQEADSAAQLAEEEARRLATLQAHGLIPEMELVRAKTEVQKRRAAAQALRISINRLEQEQLTKDSARKTQIERLNRDATEMKADLNTKQITIERIEYETDRRRIRAPVKGPLGEVAELRIGSFVQEGDKLGAVVPFGELKVVAHFPPMSALGRIYPGQPARLRLDGFPWTQFGSIAATVKSVASEARDGQVRVELIINPDLPSRIRLQHGLPGTVEVEVEQVSPATLVLRMVGKLLSNKTVSN